jgi:serine/threonine protein kinase
VTDLTVTRSSLGPLEPLNSGGTAQIFRVTRTVLSDMPDLVYKEYNKKTIRHAGPGLGPGLYSIVESRDRLHEAQRRFIDERTLWPVRLVENDGGGACGVLMRLIPDRFFERVRAPSGDVKVQPRELLLLFMDDDDARSCGLRVTSMQTRLEMCAQVARAFGLLHKAQVIYGDVSARNVIYVTSVNSRPETILVDCDSVRIAGTRSPFGAQPHTPTWEPPECRLAQRKLAAVRRSGQASSHEVHSLKRSMMTQSTPTDVYKFGLLVVRVLDYGRGRSPNKNPTKAQGILRKYGGPELASLLRHSLADDPHDRPTMREWFEAMTGSGDSRDGHGAVPAGPRRSVQSSSPSPAEAPKIGGDVVGSWRWVEGKGWIRR